MNELEKIRSIYIFKRIFDLVIYKTELKVLKYNKNLQKKSLNSTHLFQFKSINNFLTKFLAIFT